MQLMVVIINIWPIKVKGGVCLIIHCEGFLGNNLYAT